MKIYSPLFLLGALGVLSPAGAAAAVDTSAWKCESCPYPKGTSGSVDMGLAAVSDASAKFGDFTGLQRSGAYVLLGGTLMHRSEGGYFADLVATDLGLGTRSLSAQSGREGLYSLRLGYAEVPRHLSEDAATPFLGSGGTALSLPGGFPAGTTAAMPLATTLQPVGLGYKVQRYDLGGAWIGNENWTYRVSLRHDVRDGTKRTAGLFYINASQLASPVDQVTDQIEVSAAYTSRRLQARLGYQLSQFRNGADSLTWANPFLPVVTGSSNGQLALAPDNQFHQVVGSAGYEITPTIRASGDFAVGRMTQNAPYLAPTLTPGLAATLPALPASSLDGRVDTFNGSMRITAAPIDGLRLNASYARDVRDNRTPVRSYPVVDTDMFLAPLPRSNTPFSLTQDRFKLSADYRGPGTLKLAAGAELDKRERSYQEVVNTRETTLWARIGLQPLDNLSLSLKVAHADREFDAYGTSIWFGTPENPLLRKYNLAARKRDSAGARADITLNEKVSIGLAADFANDDYDKSLIGLKEARGVNVAADMSIALSERTHLQLFAQAERIRSLQAGNQLVAGTDWTARNKDRFEVFGLGLKHTAIVDKLDIGADVSLSRSSSDIFVDAGLGDPAFPTARTKLDSVRFFATYKLDEKMSLTGSYWHERYSAEDWHLDGVLPATVSNLLAFGEQAPHYRVNVVRVSLRYRF